MTFVCTHRMSLNGRTILPGRYAAHPVPNRKRKWKCPTAALSSPWSISTRSMPWNPFSSPGPPSKASAGPENTERRIENVSLSL